MNISSLPYHFDDLKHLLGNYQSKPRVIGISECRLRTNRSVLSNIDRKVIATNAHLLKPQRGTLDIY